MNGRPEEELITACCLGDREAYAELVKKQSKRIFAICFGILGNSHDAEDITQQTLIKGFIEIRNLRDKKQFGSWVGRIARNLYIDNIRRRKRRETIVPEQPRQSLERNDDYFDLKEALVKMSAKYRSLLILYYFDGKNSNRITEALNLSRSTVLKRLSRARKQLRKLLGARGEV